MAGTVVSTVWAQLSAPNPAAGGIPFVGSDDASILIDVLNFFFNEDTFQLLVSGGIKVDFTDQTGAPGAAVTINKPSGKLRFTAGVGATVVVTNSYVDANSAVFVQLRTNDATATRCWVASIGAGTFTITFNAAPTVLVDVDFFVVGRE
jgi:hypothetical protein